MTIRPMKKEEVKYAFGSHNLIALRTGLIGYLRGDFGKDGTEFWTTWFEEYKDFKTPDFVKEFQSVIDALRFEREDLPLASREEMSRYCKAHPETEIEGGYCQMYGVRIETEKYAYLVRMIPVKGDYNFYCYCFYKMSLDSHIEEAKNGIRFLDTNANELFTIPDDSKIQITHTLGIKDTLLCRYLDKYTMLVNQKPYHVCSFVALMQDQGYSCSPKE